MSRRTTVPPPQTSRRCRSRALVTRSLRRQPRRPPFGPWQLLLPICPLLSLMQRRPSPASRACPLHHSCRRVSQLPSSNTHLTGYGLSGFALINRCRVEMDVLPYQQAEAWKRTHRGTSPGRDVLPWRGRRGIVGSTCGDTTRSSTSPVITCHNVIMSSSGRSIEKKGTPRPCGSVTCAEVSARNRRAATNMRGGTCESVAQTPSSGASTASPRGADDALFEASSLDASSSLPVSPALHRSPASSIVSAGPHIYCAPLASRIVTGAGFSP